jgi:hypothetical protein
MIISPGTTPATLRQSIAGLGYVLSDSVSDQELQGVLDRQTGSLDFHIGKDGKTIKGYLYTQANSID